MRGSVANRRALKQACCRRRTTGHDLGAPRSSALVRPSYRPQWVAAGLGSPGGRRIPPMKTPRATTRLGDLQRATPWLWLNCKRCQHHAPLACAVAVIRWGASTSSDVLRQRARCTAAPCGPAPAVPAPAWRRPSGNAYIRQYHTETPKAPNNHAPAAKKGLMILCPNRSHANADNAKASVVTPVTTGD